MERKTKIVVYKCVALALALAALGIFFSAYLIYDEVADMPITNIETKIGATRAILRFAGGIVVGFVGFLFNYTANLHRKEDEEGGGYI
ncbi:MAG: hypothetical protein GX751_04725 [Desulfuromonadaceae bacterium]|nr:hypothetical protein [Desulfuromonadaceae bacterium]